MLFRTILAPFIRIFQWSGLVPFPLIEKKPTSFWKSKHFLFTTITVVNLLLNIAPGIFALVYNLLNYQPKEGYSKLVSYTHLMTGFILRVNTITVLIETLSKRSIQAKLFETFDEIEYIFTKKLNFQSKMCPPRVRFRKFMIIWIIKNVAFTTLTVCSFLSAIVWYRFCFAVISYIPFYTSTLFYAKWMVYVDVVRFNIERLNEIIMEMDDVNRIDRPPTNGQIFQVEACPVHAFDACERFAHLRKCFSEIWHASILTNRCFRWSLLIGVGTDLYMLVVNLYFIVYSVVNSDFDSWIHAAVAVVMVVLISTNFLVMSMVCECISVDVSWFSRAIMSNIHPLELLIDI